LFLVVVAVIVAVVVSAAAIYLDFAFGKKLKKNSYPASFTASDGKQFTFGVKDFEILGVKSHSDCVVLFHRV